MDLHEMLEVDSPFRKQRAEAPVELLQRGAAECSLVIRSKTEAADLAQALRGNTTLKKLTIWFHEAGRLPTSRQLAEFTASSLALALRFNGTVEELHLDDGLVGSVGAAALAEMLKVNQNLRNLTLVSDHRGPGVPEGANDRGAAAFADALLYNRSLRELALDFSAAGCAGAALVAQSLRNNATLRRLSLSFWRLGAEGAAAIAGTLCINNTLQELALANFTVGDQEAAQLAAALTVNTGLRKLNLGGLRHPGRMGPHGAASLAEALKHNRSLQALSLSNHFLRDWSAAPLAEALAVNDTLTELNLRNTQISDASAIRLAEACRNNFALEHLHLECLMSGGPSGDTLQQVRAAVRSDPPPRVVLAVELQPALGVIRCTRMSGDVLSDVPVAEAANLALGDWRAALAERLGVPRRLIAFARPDARLVQLGDATATLLAAIA